MDLSYCKTTLTELELDGMNVGQVGYGRELGNPGAETKIEVLPQASGRKQSEVWVSIGECTEGQHSKGQ